MIAPMWWSGWQTFFCPPIFLSLIKTERCKISSDNRLCAKLPSEDNFFFPFHRMKFFVLVQSFVVVLVAIPQRHLVRSILIAHRANSVAQQIIIESVRFQRLNSLRNQFIRPRAARHGENRSSLAPGFEIGRAHV